MTITYTSRLATGEGRRGSGPQMSYCAYILADRAARSLARLAPEQGSLRRLSHRHAKRHFSRLGMRSGAYSGCIR